MDGARLLHPLAEGFELHPDREDVVLLLHGWTGSPAHLRLLGRDLEAAGFGVVAPLLPGHGTRVEDMLDTGWRDWLRAAAMPADDILARGRRLHLGGLSMGGVLAILLATTFEVSSITTINAPIDVFSRLFPLAGLVRGSDIVRPDDDDAADADYAADYAHQYEAIPIGSVAELADLVRGAKRALPLVHAPALVIQSLTDETVRPRSARHIYDRIGTTSKRLVWLERSVHVATLDGERDLIADEMIRHLRSAQGPAPLPS